MVITLKLGHCGQNTSPDTQGIKTDPLIVQGDCVYRQNTSPDTQGIKTLADGPGHGVF